MNISKNIHRNINHLPTTTTVCSKNYLCSGKTLPKILAFRKSDNFYGFCLDLGASQTVIGKHKREYRQLTAHPTQTKTSSTLFKFGSNLSKSNGITMLRLSLPDGQVIYFKADIVNDDTPLLLGLDEMRKHGLIFDFKKEVVQTDSYELILPIKYHKGYAFLPLLKSICFKRPELPRLHLHFFILLQINSSTPSGAQIQQKKPTACVTFSPISPPPLQAVANLSHVHSFSASLYPLMI